MEKKSAKLIITDSYFGLFDALARIIKDKARGLDGKNLVFCEEKVSLMAERRIARETGGSFNTEVYSFGNYLRVKKPSSALLSKEGSAMVVKRILNRAQLSCFNKSRINLAPSLYELIIQLKSAAVTPEVMAAACGETEGILGNKLKDVAAVFSAYEDYLSENGLKDQNSALADLPEIIENDADMPRANVFIVGFTGLTVQMCRAISALLKRAASVTAVLAGGDNGFAFVNETGNIFSRLCADAGLRVNKEYEKSDYGEEGRIIAEGLFNPAVFKRSAVETDKILFFAAEGRRQEVNAVASVIKESVMRGECRYRDCTVICPDKNLYKREIREIFGMLDIPCFFDEKKKPDAHPLITLIISYIEVFRKGFSLESLSAFFKNPLICADKTLADKVENYLVKYNIEYARFKAPLVFAAEDDALFTAFEAFRQEICEYFSVFDVSRLLIKSRAEEKIAGFSPLLEKAGEAEEAALNDQIYAATKALTDEMNKILGDGEISYTEYKNVFLSGVAAMELSIIPQYNDAVFIGGFKETALVKAENLFAIGLTSSVPEIKDDVALLSDGDINALSRIKVLVEPKIQVVNHRAREETALGMSAFSGRLYLSYPISSGGKKNVKSEILSYLEKMFTLKPFPERHNYLTEKQGLRSFSREAGRFARGKTDDFTVAASFYRAERGGKAEKIAEYSNKEIKQRLVSDSRILLKDVTSPTAIEDFYKCPYRSFMIHGLKATEREECALDGISVGIIMHEIFKEYLSRAENVTEKAQSDALFEEVSKKVINKDEYRIFLSDARLKAGLDAALEECRKFCFMTARWLACSDFYPDKRNLEVGFGDDPEKRPVYPAIKLLGGRIKLSGKIDRVDTYGDYFRIIDYKTGSASNMDKGLFSGTRLQLYLYASAVQSCGKKLAGAYYMHVSDPYRKVGEKIPPLVTGKTLGEKEAVTAQDRDIERQGESEFIPVTVADGKIKDALPASAMSALTDYAVKMSENAAREMKEGVIVASPYETACGYCPFAAVCGATEEDARKLSGVNEDTLIAAAACGTGGEKDART